MKKNTFIIFVLCLFAITLKGQETIEVKLNEDTPCLNNHSLKYANAFITVCSNKTNDEDVSSISVKIENTDESLMFIVFGHGWTKKELRKFHIINETSNEKSARIEYYPDLNYDTRLNPSDDFTLPSFEVRNEQETIHRIPFYIAKEKRKFLCKKTYLLEKQIVELRITIEANKDKEFPRIKQECDSLYDAYALALDNHQFCSHPAHKPSLKEQTKNFVAERDDLRLIINMRLTENHWSTTSKQYTVYQELLSKLDKINPDIIDYDCGIKENHVRTHSCSYCDLSLSDIYNKLQAYYINLTQGDKTKAEIWDDVNSLYTCYTKSNKNPNRKKEGKVVKDGIVKYYNLIKKKQ